MIIIIILLSYTFHKVTLHAHIPILYMKRVLSFISL